MFERRELQTARLRFHLRERPATGEARRRLLLVHGNASSAVFFEELLAALPPDIHAVAPDLRGYGDSEARPIDATRGVRDWSDDLAALLDALGWERAQLLGWSLGGCVVMQLALSHPARVEGLTLVAPGSPYGFGGTHGAEGQPNSPDFAGSGGGTVNADFVRAIAAGDRSDAPGSPRQVMRQFYFNPQRYQPSPEREEAFLDGLLKTRTGDDFYPGDQRPSEHWPHVAPGTRGIANAISPQYLNLSGFADLDPPPPVLWVRGDADAIVSDQSLFDLARLGQLGAVPGWPGESCPPQPMVGQMRAVLERAKANGGSHREVVLAGVGHSPFLEEPAAFLEALAEQLG